MPINASHEFYSAEKEYLNAQTLEQRIFWLEEMIRKAPKHKSSENFLAELKTRLIKLRDKSEKLKKKSSGKKGIKKDGYQFVIIGKPNSGKSTLLSKLTNASPRISDHPFSTTKPEIGTFFYEGVKAQIIDMPSIGSEGFDIGIVNTADCILEVVEKTEDLEDIEKVLSKAYGKKIAAINKSDLLSFDELRKLIERMKSKRILGCVVSAKMGDGVDVLKQLMFREMEIIRVFTKEPGKEASKIPVVLKDGACVKDVAESILKGFSNKVKETRLTGPSGKFPNQKVGLEHKLRDLDIVEFHT